MNVENFEKTFKVSQLASLVVENIRGKVMVKPGNEEEIFVRITKHLDSGNPENTTIKMIQDNEGELTVKTSVEKDWLGFTRRPCKIDMEIVVPAQCSLKVQTVSAGVFVTGIQGQVKVKSVSGRIDIKKTAGTLDLNSVSGNIHGTQIEGPALIKTVSGKLFVDDSIFPSLNASTVSGKAVIQTSIDEGPYKLSTVSGKVKFVVPAQSALSVNASSISGRFYTTLNASRKDISNRKWDLDFSGGGAPVKMSTISGNIHLVTSLDERGDQPVGSAIFRKEKISILSSLEQGEISVDEAINNLTI